MIFFQISVVIMLTRFFTGTSPVKFSTGSHYVLCILKNAPLLSGRSLYMMITFSEDLVYFEYGLMLFVAM